MNEERWQRIERLFHEALARPPGERARFVEESEADPELRAEVQALLDADAEPDTIFRASAEELAGAAGLAAGSLVGRTVGPYRVLERIGQGGMGTVYRAVREDLGNQVALKVVRGALGDAVRLARFRQEQRVLARLAHPRIARLLDAGVAGDETPYLVMELVEGDTITEWCDARALDVEARLRLFLEVCEAVAFAHRHFVVHRDVKPSNVLVARDGHVKLLDFGVAKLLEGTDSDAALTSTGARVLSPEYASPEQVRGEPVTTATDVYGLGLLLYELLTGRSPRPVRSGHPADLTAAVVTADVQPPSRTARGGRGGGASRASGDGRARGLAAVLAGDLDAICLRALEVDPARRYASVESLRDDIERHLDGRPVSARLPTLGYRAGKFVRRHALSVGVAAVLVVLLAAGIGAVLWQAERARRAQATAEELSGFLVELFEASDPNEALGRTVSARDLLDRGRIRVDQLGDRPEVQARMLDAIARAYIGLGDFALADSLARRALAQERALHGERHVDVAAALTTLGRARSERGREAEAVALLRSALELRRDLLGERHDLTTASMLELAAALRQDGGYDEAVALAREALAARTAAHGRDHERVAEALELLASVLFVSGRELDRAEDLFREALALRERVMGPDDPRLESALTPLSALLVSMNQPAEAEALARRALEIRRTVYGDEHPMVAHQLHNVARAVLAQGGTTEARAMYRDALRRYAGVLDDDHPMVELAVNNISATFYQEGALDSAEHYLRRALEVRIRRHGEVDANATLMYHNLGSLLRARGRLADAEDALREAYRQRIELYGADNPVALRTGAAYGDVLAQRGKLDEAEPLLRAILERQRAATGDGSPDVSRTMGFLAGALTRRGDFAAAEALFLPALEVARQRMPPTHPRRQELVTGLVELYEAWGRTSDARRVRSEEEPDDG